MGITYKIDAEAGVIYSFAEGKIGAADIIDNRKQVRADPLWRPNLDSLFDGRSAKFSISGEEARGLAIWAQRNRPTAKGAIVINRQAQGFARMFLGWEPGNQQIFHDMASAREWLGLPPEEEE